MENKFLERIYGNMGYNTYNTIQSISSKSSIGLVLAKAFLLKQYPIANTTATILAGMIFAYYLANNNLKAENYTKDITEIKKIYQELITNYNKLNQTFGFDNPIEIYSMYNYLLYEGYLSKDKNFEFSSKVARDINEIYGTNVINGQAVCRHIARMLSDILNNKGIDSNVLPVYTRTSVITIHTDATVEKQTTEQLYEFVKRYINDEEMRKVFNEVIAESGDKIHGFYHRYENDKGLGITRVTGNHAITLANKDGKSYILDPTQSRIYKLSLDDNSFLVDNDEDRIKICYGTIGLFNKKKDYKTIKSKLALPSTPLEEDLLLATRTRELCKSNLDIMEQFYNENSEMYSELSDRLIGLKQQGRLIKRVAK